MQIAELQLGLMGELIKEIGEHLKTLSTNLMEEMRMQLSTIGVATTSTVQSLDHHTATPQVPLMKQ